jgi:hypothetical protein
VRPHGREARKNRILAQKDRAPSRFRRAGASGRECRCQTVRQAQRRRKSKNGPGPAERDWAVEPNWQACCLRRDYGAISLDDPLVDAAIGITVAVLHRDKIEFDTVDVAADRIEERIKATIGFEKLCRAAVNIVGADRFEAFVEAPGSQSKSRLILGAEPDVEALSSRREGSCRL